MQGLGVAKLECLCGNLLSNVACPNEIEGYLLTDMDVDVNKIDPIEDGRSVWECDECGRLAFSHPGRQDCSVKWYRPEDGQPGGLMKYNA